MRFLRPVATRSAPAQNGYTYTGVDIPDPELEKVALMGATCNLRNREKVARLAAIRRQLLSGAPASVPATPRPPARAGEVVEAVQSVLTTHGTMRVTEVFLAVQNQLQGEVNRSTVKACLSEGTLAKTPRFKRMGHGRYRMA